MRLAGKIIGIGLSIAAATAIGAGAGYKLADYLHQKSSAMYGYSPLKGESTEQLRTGAIGGGLIGLILSLVALGAIKHDSPPNQKDQRDQDRLDSEEASRDRFQRFG